MTNEEILKKSIEKALHNNWEQMLLFVPTWALEQANEDRLTQHIIKTYGKSIIFSHDFAKAFFPKTDEHGFHKDEVWKYYLQQMVLENNPLHYLKKFL